MQLVFSILLFHISRFLAAYGYTVQSRRHRVYHCQGERLRCLPTVSKSFNYFFPLPPPSPSFGFRLLTESFPRRHRTKVDVGEGYMPVGRSGQNSPANHIYLGGWCCKSSTNFFIRLVPLSGVRKRSNLGLLLNINKKLCLSVNTREGFVAWDCTTQKLDLLAGGFAVKYRHMAKLALHITRSIECYSVNGLASRQ